MLWGTIALSEIFENLLSLKGFGLYFEGILSRMIDSFWCVILIRLSLEKIQLFIIQNINYSYTPGYTIAMGYFAPRKILKTCSS